MATNEIKVFCPATVANVSCGFDVLGVALDSVGDEMVVRKVPQKGIKITKLTGQDLPKETLNNVAGVAGNAFLLASDYDGGFEIEIDKKIKPGSGIGSSAASSAGAVWAMNHLLGNPFSKTELVKFAMEGERLASDVAHADNVAPALFGGFTLVRSYSPLDIIDIPAPTELYLTIIHPQIEIKTSDSRKILKTTISMETGIKQWGNVGGLVAGLFKKDYDLIGRSLEDHIVEPIRSILIPGFDEVKKVSLEAGALGSGISGSGPSIFAFSKGKDTALKVGESMKKVYDKIGIDYEIHVSKINTEGVKIL
ncbi:MAG: homoserine kinase [Maribacter dokdonensis]|uniref:Homoserine kinase n=1 Tax=Maribacter dokdonensis TaxID=320912 RepID=A0ABY0U4E6_9FLAO|nr:MULTISPECIES: homoserine kinase [Maribacter]APA63277.1 serine kinase [Maribacter sp. 1_2014MBL_MicDiv]KSA12170.1 Homoserine kinase [Maribacter dokdonensis DSW-8]PHN92885.1 homoserine kinase [Maribacter sp. 6B07]SDS04659.1 homoserine kinase [Maribacter dokdonensis]|tara:strand:+ start:452 stop:1378 length:927 start_codon:yes stop_codon:yes gene_type:complete